MATSLDLGQRAFALRIADEVRDARRLVGWTQRGLAARARTSQATVSRVETGTAAVVDVLVLERILAALGIRATLTLDARHLDDRRRQADGVHARLNGYLARRLERDGWRTALEVPIGGAVPRGWIDLLAFRETDRAMLIEETKTDIPDIGALQRSLAFYEREAWAAARMLGWRPSRAVALVVALDTETVARRLADSRETVARAFPGSAPMTAAWLRDPACAAPRGWTLATADPAGRGATWLHATTLGTRRRPPAYAGYAEAAARLLRR
ncbi:MAG TPA: helix-turn-helix transcriptional regulator [Candidatus Limnocylindrales bacterium]|nr:helix-turn-helix transcriptional regulator [Candidatus Limnocylindrales bacterium]